LYSGIHEILQHLRYDCVPVPVDANGLMVAQIPEDMQASAVLVTPSHHFPSGCVLPIQRRIQLIEYARRTDTLIIENDHDSEFRYSGSPISSIHMLAPERVAHVGTFSESLYPSARLGYLVLPHHLVEVGRRFKRALGLAASSLPQLALARFIEEGHLERHIGAMKKEYLKRRTRLIACLHEAFGDRVTIRGDATGLYLAAEFQDYEFSDQMIEQIARAGVWLGNVEEHALIKGRYTHQVVIGYGCVPLEEIEIGVARLKAALA
jgi:GntR family transcriptional regulator / MocR family aminotransferase